MKEYTPVFILLCLVTLFGFILLGDGSLSRLRTAGEGLAIQVERNNALRAHVEELKREAHLLQKDPRFLEKTARNELGLARPGELVYFFEERDSTQDESVR